MAAWRAAFFALAAAVLWLALAPRPPEPIDIGWDKANHVAAFAALAFAGALGFAGARGAMPGIAVALLLFGLAIEALQALVPSRTADWNDVLADACGIAAGLLLAAALEAVRRRRRDLRTVRRARAAAARD